MRPWALSPRCPRIRASAVGLNGSRFRSGLQCRGNGIQTGTDRAQCLLIHLAGYFQAIANLVTPNCRNRLGVVVTRNGAIVETLLLESLLQRAQVLVGTHESGGT